MQGKRIHERSVSVKVGSEGPQWDPYSYEEVSWTENGSTLTLHSGLANYLRLPDGQKVEFGDYETEPGRIFALLTGLPLLKLDTLLHKLNGPKNKCPNCGGREFSWFSGYVGESMQGCNTCGDIVWCQSVTPAMIG